MTRDEPMPHAAEDRPPAPSIRVRVNGEYRRLAAGTALAAYLAEQSVPAQYVAVAVNSEVVRRADHARVILHDGDVVEIVRMVGGGSLQFDACARPAARPIGLDRALHNRIARPDRQKGKLP